MAQEPTKEKGWWNYNWEAPIKEEPELKPSRKNTIHSLPSSAPKKLTVKQLWSMHPDQFQDHLKQVQKWAVKTLAPEDVAHYRKVQDVARRKAAAYAAVSTYVAERDPASQRFDLDMPVNAPGRYAVESARKKELLEFLQSRSHQYGLVYFRSETCSACRAQDGIMNYFRRELPTWNLEDVDVNQRPDLAGLFGVQSTPTLALLEKDNQEPEILAVGVLALDQLSSRLYRRIRAREGAAPEQYFTQDSQRGGALDPLAGGTP